VSESLATGKADLSKLKAEDERLQAEHVALKQKLSDPETGQKLRDLRTEIVEVRCRIYNIENSLQNAKAIWAYAFEQSSVPAPSQRRPERRVYDPDVRDRKDRTYCENLELRRSGHDAKMSRWLAMGIPNYIAELQVSYERHIEIRRMRDVAGMSLAAIGARVHLSTERVRQIYLSKKHKYTPPAVRWLREGETSDFCVLTGIKR
jgi:hypothetical protein